EGTRAREQRLQGRDRPLVLEVLRDEVRRRQRGSRRSFRRGGPDEGHGGEVRLREVLEGLIELYVGRQREGRALLHEPARLDDLEVEGGIVVRRVVGARLVEAPHGLEQEEARWRAHVDGPGRLLID